MTNDDPTAGQVPPVNESESAPAASPPPPVPTPTTTEPTVQVVKVPQPATDVTASTAGSNVSITDTTVAMVDDSTKAVGDLKVGDIIAPTPMVDDDDTISSVPVSDENVDEDEDLIMEQAGEEKDEGLDTPTEEILYPPDKIDFRGEVLEKLVDLIRARETEVGALGLDNRVRTVGTWENLMFRALMENSAEEQRIQEALSNLTPEEMASLSHRYPKDRTQKAVLRTASIVERGEAGETRTLTGDAAVMAFEYQETGGGYRIPLYNSGITIDVLVPTGNDIQTMLSNCLVHDRELGSANGAHYFTYGDLMYKTQILNFLNPLIMGSSYVDWKKKGKLWSVIKLPDLMSIVAHLAALCYKDGFEGFTTKCTRPISEEHPTICGHTETITANIFELIVTRFAVLSEASVSFMQAARAPNAKHTLADIAKYQAGLGLEGERITFGNVTFTMRIPSLAEHSEAGTQFISDIINEIEADNTDGRYEHFGLRYIRTFMPFIASVEKVSPNGAVNKTDESRVILRQLEKLDQEDEDDKVKEALRKYINKVQLTYVGYPVLPCDVCGYTGDTPSGMWTFDPFSTFFTLAFLYLKQPA